MRVTNKYIQDAIRLSYLEFNDLVMSIADLDVLETMLVKLLEVTDRKTKRHIKRVHGRYNKLRAKAERDMLEEGFWYEI